MLGLIENVYYLLVCDLVQWSRGKSQMWTWSWTSLCFTVLQYQDCTLPRAGTCSCSAWDRVLQWALAMPSVAWGLLSVLLKSVMSPMSGCGITSQFCSVKRLHTGHDYLSVLKSWCVCYCQNQTHLFPFFSLFFPVWQVRSQIRQPLLSTFQRECSPSSLVSLLMVLLALLLLVFNWWVVFWSIHF